MEREGRLVGERYRLLRRVGSGTSGTVWRAYDESAEREVAVKRPRLPGDPADETYRRAAHRLYREARAAARVDHPAAVRVHDVVVEEAGREGLPWIVTEWVPGESLDAVAARGPVAASEAARIGLAVLGALRAAHAVGIVHRAVRPAHVLLGPDGRVVLTDFGTAHLAGGSRGAGPAADLRALGALLHAAAGDGSALGPVIEGLRAAGPDAEGGAGAAAEEVAAEAARGLRAVAERGARAVADRGPGVVAERGARAVADRGPGVVADRGPGVVAERGPRVVAERLLPHPAAESGDGGDPVESDDPAEAVRVTP